MPAAPALMLPFLGSPSPPQSQPSFSVNLRPQQWVRLRLKKLTSSATFMLNIYRSNSQTTSSITGGRSSQTRLVPS